MNQGQFLQEAWSIEVDWSLKIIIINIYSSYS